MHGFRHLAVVALSAALLSACTAATPAPTQPPAPKPAEPTKAAAPAAAQPTTAPAKPTTAPAPAQPTQAPAAVAFPEKGKTATVIIPFAAGGGSDIQMRILAPEIEKLLGIPISPVNKPGAGSQVGNTELAKSKPDGYTIGATNTPSAFMPYLDPERKAAYGRKDLQPVANVAVDPSGIAVKADSPYKTIDDLVKAAKANPGKIKMGTGGIMGSQHISAVLFAKAAGIDVSTVHFDGGGPALTALLGGHIDVTPCQIGEELPFVKQGTVRILAVMDKEKSKFLPDVPTLESAGFKAYGDSSRGISLPAGTPKEIVKVWSDAIIKAASTDAFKTKMDEQGIAMRIMDTAQYEKYWDDYETLIKPLVPDLKKQ